jgi:hypothetical protein
LCIFVKQLASLSTNYTTIKISSGSLFMYSSPPSVLPWFVHHNSIFTRKTSHKQLICYFPIVKSTMIHSLQHHLSKLTKKDMKSH